MQTLYDAIDDIFTIKISNKPIAREISEDWNTCISYAKDGSLVEIVILEASKQGVFPPQITNQQETQIINKHI